MKKAFKIGCLSVLGLLVFLFVLSLLLPDRPVEETGKTISGPERRVTRSSEGLEPQEPPVPVMEPEPKRDAFLELAPEAEIAVHALDLIDAYEVNEFAADAKYKGKIVLVRGEISNMHDTFGMLFVNLESVNYIVSVSCEMQKIQMSRLQQLRKGQDVLVVGEVRGSTAGLSVDLKDCVIMSVEEYEKQKAED